MTRELRFIVAIVLANIAVLFARISRWSVEAAKWIAPEEAARWDV